MINQQLLEDLRTTLPGDVRTATGEEAGDRVACEMVDPAFFSQLPHDGVDPGEARCAGGPALEPGFLLWVVDLIGTGYEFVAGVYFARKVPGDETAVAVVVWVLISMHTIRSRTGGLYLFGKLTGLRKAVARCCLSS